MKATFNTAVIIPARNEVARIATCLSALAPQVDEQVLVVVVANNCTDGTARAARGIIYDQRFALLECVLDASQGVGEARRRGCLHALARHPKIQALLTTDADCIVAHDWIAATRRHLTEVDAVCGRIDPIASETAILAGMPSKEGSNEATYRNLVLQFYDLLAPEAHNRYPHHGEAAGASLACRSSAWTAVGGFADIQSGEDRDLVRRLRAAGFRVRHADDVRVQASCRLKGRAPGGMADALSERLAGVNYRIDEALPPVSELIAMAKRRRLDVWPPDTPLEQRLLPVALPQEIRRLQNLLMQIKATEDRANFPFEISSAQSNKIETPPAFIQSEVQPDV